MSLCHLDITAVFVNMAFESTTIINKFSTSANDLIFFSV